MRPLLALLCLHALALPARAQPPEVIEGQDLAAWRKIPHAELSTEQRMDAYHSFILKYPTSALAEVAWIRLEPSQRALLTDVPRAVITHLERSREAHELVLNRIIGEVYVVDLGPGGEERSLKRTWHGNLQLGATLDRGGPWATIGLRVGQGPWSGTVRVSRGSQWSADATVRLNPGWWGALYVEAGAAMRDDKAAWGIASGGLRTRLFGETWLETGLGVAAGPQMLSPIARIEIAHQVF